MGLTAFNRYRREKAEREAMAAEEAAKVEAEEKKKPGRKPKTETDEATAE